eukprot:jgi/Tetstr1/429399/TSEL_019311.t2
MAPNGRWGRLGGTKLAAAALNTALLLAVSAAPDASGSLCPLLPRTDARSQESAQCKAHAHAAAVARKDGRVRHCFRPFTVRLRAEAAGRTSGGGNLAGGKLKMRHVAGGSAVGVRLPWGRRLLGAAAPGVDLASAADWSRCAVVGSSSSLSGKRMGRDIDVATAVIRFNDAPTGGRYAMDAGSRTTLRVQNFIYCGYHEQKSELLLYYFAQQPGAPGGGCKSVNHPPGARGRMDTGKGVFVPVELLRQAVRFFRDVDPQGREPSVGFFGVLLALQLCGEVTLYGFDQGGAHYYAKGFGHPQAQREGSERGVRGRHSWPFERQCLRAYGGVLRERFRIAS